MHSPPSLHSPLLFKSPWTPCGPHLDPELPSNQSAMSTLQLNALSSLGENGFMRKCFLSQFLVVLGFTEALAAPFPQRNIFIKDDGVPSPKGI